MTGPGPRPRPGGQPLPAFVGIGALKAGTTYLDQLLRSHPELCLPRGVKEVDYFSRHYERGAQWYRAQFDGCASRRHGEVSPRYLVDAAVPARIATANPAAKLLLLVRDPVSRAHSQYKHRVRTTGYRGSFEEYLGANPGTVDRGRYFHHTSRWLAVFGTAQLHVVVFEDLVRQPLPTMRTLYRFLEVDEDHPPGASDRPANVSVQPGRRRTYVVAKRMSRLLHDSGHGRGAAWVSRSPVAGWLTGRPTAPVVEPVAETTARWLRSQYGADVQAMSALLDRDLAQLWWTPSPEQVR